MTAILAFLIVTLSFAIGDMISMKTKGMISSFVFTILIFVIFGGTLHIFPEDMIATAGLSNMLVSFGMGLIFTNIGSSLNARELASQWKTILVTLCGMALVTVFCFTLGTAIFGREQALSAVGTLCGGFGATVLTSELANAAGRADIAIFVTVMMTLQCPVRFLWYWPVNTRHRRRWPRVSATSVPHRSSLCCWVRALVSHWPRRQDPIPVCWSALPHPYRRQYWPAS